MSTMQKYMWAWQQVARVYKMYGISSHQYARMLYQMRQYQYTILYPEFA